MRRSTAAAVFAAASLAAGGSAAPPPVEAQVTVEELPAADRWRVRYRFSRPLAGLRFARRKHRFRVAGWKVTGGDARWAEAGGAEALVAGDPGRGVREVALELATDATERPGDYRLHHRATDGSRLLSTGHFEVQALACASAGRCAPGDLVSDPSPVRYRWRFKTAPGRRVALLEQDAVKEVAWTQPAAGFEVGTYVYFGGAKPDRAARFAAVLDPGLPPWIRDSTRGLLGKLFEFFTRLTGVALPARPLVLVTYDPSEARLAHKGGALDGVLQVHLSGEGWREETPAVRRRWEKLLAHESFHFWNGLTYRYRLGGTERWVSEGGADYFAWIALRALGRASGEEVRAAMVRAANLCAVKLFGRPLVAARGGGGDHRLPYHCGMAMHYLAERQLRAASGGETSLGDLYREMFRRSTRQDMSYTSYDFLELLHEMTGKPTAPAPLTRVIYEGLGTRGVEFFRAQLAAYGVPVEAVGPDKAAALGPDLPRLAARLVAACDCAGKWSFQTKGRAVEYLPVDGCHLFRARTRVTHVQGVPLVEHPAVAYAAAIAAVDAGAPLLLTRQRSADPAHLACPPARAATFPRQFLMPAGP